VAVFVVVGAITVSLLAPFGYALSTVRSAHGGALPTAGPAGASTLGGPGGFGGRGAGPGGFAAGPPGGFAANGTGTAGGFTPPTGTGNAAPGGGAAGGLLNGSRASAALTRLLERDAGRYTWVAATVGSNSASGYQLASDDPVMAIGGFNGSDPTPTLAQFEAYVRAGRIHYFIAGGVGGAGGGFGGGPGGVTSNAAARIRSWVQANFTATTVGGVTVYDLTQV